MPNWKKVVVSGSAANLHSLNVSTDVTASNISSSGNIFGNLSENSSTLFKTVVVDPSTGQFYKTGSYSGGGGGGTGNGFPFTGDAQITGSLLLSGSQNIKDGNLTISGSSTYSILITGSSTQNTSNGSEIAILDTTRHTGNSYSYGPKITLKANPNDSTYGTTTTINAISTVSGGIGLGSRTVINSNRELVYNNTTTGYNGVGLRIRNNTSPANRNTEHIFAMQNQSGGYAHIARSQMGTGRIFLHGLGTSGVYGMMLKANQNQYLIIGPQTSGTDGSEVVKITSTGFKTTGFIEAVGNITASGNISASGALISSELTASGLRYPSTDGTDGQVLITDGSGVLTFNDNITYVTVNNNESGTLTKGTPVHATGTSGNTPLVVAASASVSTKMPATFVLAEDLASGAEGRAVLSGFLNGVNTNGFTEGDVLYVAPYGGYSLNKPSGSNLIQNIALVGKADTNGSIYVYGSGRSNDVPNLLDNQIFFGSGSNQTQQIHISGALDSTIINNITASGNISGSSISTASFGTYIGDGSQLTGLISSSYAVTASHALNVTTPTLQEVTTAGNTTNQGLIVTGSTTFKPISSGNGGAIELTNIGYSGLDNPIMTFKDGQGNSNVVIGHRANDGQIQIYDEPNGLRTVLSANFSAFNPGSTTGNGTYFGLTSSMAPTSTNGRAYIKMYEASYSGAPAYNFQLNNRNYAAGSGTIGLYGIMSTTSTAAPAIQITSINSDKVVNFGGPSFIHSSGKQNNYLKYGLQIGGGFTGTNANMPLTDGSLIMSGSGGLFSIKSVSSEAEIKTNNGATTLTLGTTSSFTAISASSYISASAFIGDGSQLTGISAGTDFTQSLFVSPSGDNSTAVVGDMSKPFATILGATGSANPGDTIIVYPGTYEPTSQIIKDHVNYYFHPGAIVTGSIALMEGTFDNINVRGYGTFDVSGNVTGISVTANGHIEVDKFVIRGITTTNRKRMTFNGSGSGLLELKGTGIAEGPGGRASEIFSFGTGEVLADIQAFDNTTIGDVCIEVTGAGTKNINAYAVSKMGHAAFIYTSNYPEAISLTGHFETQNQANKYALYLYTGNGADIKVDAHIVGSIYSLNSNNHLTQIHGSQVCSASPSNDAAVSCYNGEHLLNQYLRCSTPTAYYLDNVNGQVTVTGVAQPEGQYKRLMDVQNGKFVWRGTSFNQYTRAESSKIEGTGTVIIDSPLFHYGANYPINEYAFNLNSADATLEINNKLEYNHDRTGSGVININAGRLVLDGAQIIHGGGTGSYAYAIKLNDSAHSGSIFNNSFTNLTPFGPGSFTNEIVGGGTLFYSDKLY